MRSYYVFSETRKRTTRRKYVIPGFIIRTMGLK